MKNQKTIILLSFIFLLALFLRLYKLGSVPSGFHQDEVVNAYVGRFILQNGTDLYGNRYPIFYFNKWGDYPPVLSMYFASLGTYLFGMTQLGGRLSIALFSSLIIFPMFFISKALFQNEKTAFFASFLSAVLPWLINFSRIGTEGSLAVTTYFIGLGLFISLKEKNYSITKLIFSSLILLSTYLFYPGFRILVPLTFLGLNIYLYFQNKNSPLWRCFLVITIGSFFLTFLVSQTIWGKSRFEQTSILGTVNNNQEAVNAFIYNEDNSFVARVFNNKLIYLGREFIRQYASYFSPIYLFVDGGKPDWFRFPNSGLLYLSLLLLIIPVVFQLFQPQKIKFEQKRLLLILYLFLISPIAAALTNEQSPNTHRSLLMAPFFILLFGYGFQLLSEFKWGKTLGLRVFAIIFSLEIVYFSHNYFQHVGMYTAIARSDGNRQAVEYILKNKNHYQKVYMLATGWFPIYYLYFANDFQPNLVGQIQKGMRMEKRGNVYFADRDCWQLDYLKENVFSSKNNEKNLLLFNSACEIPNLANLKKVADIENSYSLPIYRAYEVTKSE